jgi:preprotein translocase subunit SecY
MAFQDILRNLPEVRGPTEKKLGFNIKLKWTLIVLISFFVLANITLYGIAPSALERFEYLEIILGTDFGSIITLGIGPIVMASIILQLLVGSKILNIDMTSEEGKKYFSGLQKLMVFFFIIFEASVYVLMGGIPAESPNLIPLVIFQMVLGGLLILFMDEVCHKWGFGSGVSLFIAAGVGWRLFTGLFGILNQSGQVTWPLSASAPVGKIFVAVYSIINPNPGEAFSALVMILATIAIFLIVVWAQSLKVEVPLSYDRLRGYGIKWPLAFFYASVIPVILVSALVANVQLFGDMMQGWLGHPTLLGNFVNGQAVCQLDSALPNKGCGFAFWVSSTKILEIAIKAPESLETIQIFQSITHILFYMIFAGIFSIFWVKTSGMDAQSQAHNILSSGLQIPGFRKDERILESVLKRYIMPLTVMGGAAIGLLSALSDLAGTIVSGSALLLGIMIMFQFYQNISQQHAMDMHPAMKKFMG